MDILLWAIVIILSIAIIYEDKESFQVSDFKTVTLITLGLVRGLLKNEVFEYILGLSIYPLPFILIYGYFDNIFRKEVIGFGDIKVVMGVGGVLTFTTLLNVYYYLTIAFFLGATYIPLKYMLSRRKVERIPFAPALILSGYIIYFCF